MNVYLPYTPRLPSTYQEVEYIESSGTQYINTGVVAGTINSIEAEYVYPTLKNAVNVLCGVRDTSATSLSPLRINVSNVIASYFINGEVSTGVTAVAGTKYKQVVTFTSGSQTISIDGVQKATSNKSITYYNSNNYYLFGFKETDSTVTSIGSFKLYSCKMYNGTTLVRDFVPCYRKSDNVIGLYDLVNNQFYTNSGTGTFSKGSDVTMAELKNAYIGEVYEYSYDFRNKSTSQITTDGWSYSAGVTPSFGTYGVYGSTIRLSYDISSYIPNAKKIKIGFTTTSKGSGSSSSVRLAKTVTSNSRVGLTGPGYNDTTETYMQIYDTKNSYSGISSGTYQFEGIIDLENKTWKLSITGKSDQTGTLTDTQVSNILNNTTKLFVYVSSGDGSTNYGTSTISLTIEY